MSFRLPGKKPADLWSKSPAGVLDYEIAQETASALGRHGRALEAALRALADFDLANPAPGPQDREARAVLVAKAAHTLWLFIVQREACGMRDGGVVMRAYGVPAEVRDRMGAFPPGRP
ncbi:MAG TPA: DUF6665 family protein [Xanthobacteraceae bacterium]